MFAGKSNKARGWMEGWEGSKRSRRSKWNDSGTTGPKRSETTQAGPHTSHPRTEPRLIQSVCLSVGKFVCWPVEVEVEVEVEVSQSICWLIVCLLELYEPYFI